MNIHQDGKLNVNFRHGLHGSKLYEVWKTMKQRCSNPNNSHYNNYGARGISVCEEWAGGYKEFYDWAIENGYQQGLSIERMNNDGNYCPENCKWIPMSQQARNTRKNVFITVGGRTETQIEWSRITGVDNSRLSLIRRTGGNVEKVISDAIAYRRKPEAKEGDK